MWFKYSKNIPNNTKLSGKSFQHFYVDYMGVRRFCAEGVEGGLVDLFSDAMFTEDVPEDFVGGDGKAVAEDGADGVDGASEVFGE